MALHTGASPTIAKRLWGAVRVTMFMIRKGLVSKRKLIMDTNMMMKRGKVWRKTLTNLMFHHHHGGGFSSRGGYGLQEYEFSCSDSPTTPVFFRALKRKHAHAYFPCINPPPVTEEELVGEDDGGSGEYGMLVPKTPATSTFGYFHNASRAENAVQERLSPLVFSPFSVRVSDYSSEGESEWNESNRHVDDEAEEFIRRFYEQLRNQNTQLLQYQEGI
ncbi:hypothetical protein SAY87_025687 [Trapa incisa]|uniref:Cotton fiber protein n=1 Tax=Trapa incisa TaxID=236973 RepID=A0AAN7JK72_9MYRT|nr:hypothetical protein SAY87_025687 [Trapa incisa]